MTGKAAHRLLATAAIALLLVITACGRGEEAVQPAIADAVTTHGAVEVDWETDFPAALERARSEGKPVLVNFYADWCVPCRGMEPTIRRLQEEGYPVRRVNVDQNPDLARQFSVNPIPCFVMVKDGLEVDRVVGSTSFERLVQLFRQAGYGPASADQRGVRGQSPDPVTLSSVLSR